MDNIYTRITAAIAAITIAASAMAQTEAVSDTTATDAGIDTLKVLHDRNYSRFDHGLSNYLFIPKGEIMFGLTASYGSLQSDDVQFLDLMDDINFKGTTYSIKPYVAYAVRDNSAIGMRVGYSHSDLLLNSMNVDIDDDINFNLSNVGYNRTYYSASVFYRHYVGLDQNKRFGLFNEVDITYGNGTAEFTRNYNSEPRVTRTTTNEGRLNFSPGLCVFVHNNLSFNVSFGVFGLYFKNEKQRTNEVEEGSRFSSGANFKFNIFNINLGIAVHI